MAGGVNTTGSDKVPGVIRCECGGKTTVINVRGRVTLDVIWRQRKCDLCQKHFTTFESRALPHASERADRAASRLRAAVLEAKNLLNEIKVEESS